MNDTVVPACRSRLIPVATDCNAFLRQPNNLEEMEVKMGNLRDSTRAAVLRLASEWPAGCGAIPSYLQLQQ